jgi:hypothetical protein
MSIKVTVKPKKAVVSSVNIGPKPSLTLGQILNVDATDPDDGEVLVYDGVQNKYVVKAVIIDANNITNIAGGLF